MDEIGLPEPSLKGSMSVEEAMQRRRSRRRFGAEPLSLQQVSQLLWCAQGITGPHGRRRTAPSAGATCPMELFVAVGEGTVEGLAAGLYRYLPAGHALRKKSDGDVRALVAGAALGQDFLAEAPLDILMAADYGRTGERYGERGARYVHMEAGHISENIYLQAEALGLGTVAVGAFDDRRMAEAFRLPAHLKPLYLMPVGRPR